MAKKDLLKELEDLGVDVNEEMTNKELEALLEATKEADSGAKKEPEKIDTKEKVEDSEENKNFPPKNKATKEMQVLMRKKTVQVTLEKLKEYQEAGVLVGYDPKEKIAIILA